MESVYDLEMKWNDRLKAARDAAGVTDTDISREVGVKNPSVNGWMTGATKTIEGENLLKVCAFLKVAPEWVIFGKEPKDMPAQNSFSAEMDRVVELLSLYRDSDAAARDTILTTARIAHAASRESSVRDNQAQLGL